MITMYSKKLSRKILIILFTSYFLLYIFFVYILLIYDYFIPKLGDGTDTK